VLVSFVMMLAKARLDLILIAFKLYALYIIFNDLT
jgi:hypothetical protein